ncbi:MAG: prolipoprotein diacylglyceryl transferase, partial [Gammaproteobacteria bacterium]|nr:prolipoprotein diacylglyceryl transferase [Gammaproteobacteria bacterium]
MYSHFDADSWVTPFGLVFVAAMITVWVLARRNASAAGIDASHVDLLFPIAVIVGVTGGTIVAIFMPMDHMVAGEMMNHGIRIRLFGMLATAAIGVFVYSRLTKMSFRSLLDVFAVPTLVGLMIHRAGCFFAGCCWGDVAIPVDAGHFTSQVSTLPVLNSLTNGVQYPPGSLPFEQHVALGLIDADALTSLP